MRFIVLAFLLQLAMPALSEEQPSDPKELMDTLVSKALTEAVGVIQESGGFYPFAMVMTDDNTVRLLGYRGKAESKPPAEQYAQGLYAQLAELLESYEGYTTAILVKPHKATGENGEPIFGVWALVDHRKRQAVIAFLPFLDAEDGKKKLGDIVFAPSENGLFPVPGTE